MATTSLSLGGHWEDFIKREIVNVRFDWLAENPLAGRERNDVHPGYRSFPQGSHAIFYLAGDGYIDIIGIPHKSIDIGPELFRLAQFQRNFTRSDVPLQPTPATPADKVIFPFYTNGEVASTEMLLVNTGRTARDGALRVRAASGEVRATILR